MRTKTYKKLLSGALLLSLAILGNITLKKNDTSAISLSDLSISISTRTEALPLKPSGDLVSRRNSSAVLRIACKGISNYTVSVWADNQNLVGQNTSNTIRGLSSTDGDRTLEQLDPGTWGIKWGISTAAGNNDKTNYSPVPLANSKSTINRKITSTGGNATEYLTLDFGIAANSSQTPDTYNGKVTVSVVGTPITTIYDVGVMQKINDEGSACSDTPTPDPSATIVARNLTELGNNIDASGKVMAIPETTMFDSRDNKEYIIRKLADGYCWMAQNLALAGGTTVNPGNTNLPFSPYTIPANEVTNGTHIDGAYNNNTTNTGASYTFNAATVGQSSSGEGYPSSGFSVCPSGWILPEYYTRNDDNIGSINYLYQRYNRNNSRFADALGLTVSSFTYWVDATEDSSYAYTFDSGGIGSSNMRANKYYVRCIYY